MDLLQVFITALGAVIVLFILTKIMGRKQMSQLSMFDYIVGISLGSIAAEMATTLEDFRKPLIAMIVFAFMDVANSFACLKSIKMRRLLTGKPVILMENGKIYEGNLRKSRIDINEFLSQCRNNGFYNIDNIQAAVLEPNGKISFLPKASHRPATPDDFNLAPSPEKPEINIIIDGNVMEENLSYSGNNEKWLENELKANGISDISDVLLATYDSNKKLKIYLKNNKPSSHSPFE